MDVLVNNAGVFVAKPTTDYDVDDVEQMIGTNLKGLVYPSQQAARHMAERGSGSIINITASLASLPQAAVPALLAVLIKGGIDHATRALAPKAVRVNAIGPGIIDTPMHTLATHEFLKTLSPDETDRHRGRGRRGRAPSSRRRVYDGRGPAGRWRRGDRALVSAMASAQLHLGVA